MLGVHGPHTQLWKELAPLRLESWRWNGRGWELRQVKTFENYCWRWDFLFIRNVHVWDVDSQKLVYKLPGHLGSVNDVDFHRWLSSSIIDTLQKFSIVPFQCGAYHPLRGQRQEHLSRRVWTLGLEGSFQSTKKTTKLLLMTQDSI